LLELTRNHCEETDQNILTINELKELIYDNEAFIVRIIFFVIISILNSDEFLINLFLISSYIYFYVYLSMYLFTYYIEIFRFKFGLVSTIPFKDQKDRNLRNDI